jgi:methyl-accepting chemotaxis protein
MDTMTQQNAALVEEDTAAAQALTAQATGLTQLIAHYRRSGSDGAESVAGPSIIRRRAHA